MGLKDYILFFCLHALFVPDKTSSSYSHLSSSNRIERPDHAFLHSTFPRDCETQRGRCSYPFVLLPKGRDIAIQTPFNEQRNKKNSDLPPILTYI